MLKYKTWLIFYVKFPFYVNLVNRLTFVYKYLRLFTTIWRLFRCYINEILSFKDFFIEYFGI